MTGPWDAPGPATGPRRYVLDVPGLPVDAYLELQERLIRKPSSRRRRWAIWLSLLLAGAAAGFLLSFAGVRAEMALRIADGPVATLGGRAILLCAAALVALTAIASLAVNTIAMVAAVMRLHRGASAVLGPQHLIFGDDALLCRAEGRMMLLSWHRLTAIWRVRAHLYLVFNGMEAVWIPDATLAEMEDRAGFEAFVAQKAADAAIPWPPAAA